MATILIHPAMKTTLPLFGKLNLVSAISAIMGAAGLLCLIPPAAAQPVPRSLPEPSSRPVDFVSAIKPILERSCLPCHGPVRPKSRFRVDSREALLRGGASGDPAILAGQSGTSPLVRYVAGLVQEMEMPPLDDREKFPALTGEQIGVLRGWIDQGARWPEGVELEEKAPSSPQPDPAASSAVRDPDSDWFTQLRLGNPRGLLEGLSDPAFLEARDAGGNTALIRGVLYLKPEQLDMLLEQGADPNATNRHGQTALMRAADDLDKLLRLLEHGADVNAASAAGNTPLIITCYYGSSETVRALLDHGADVHATNREGGTPLLAAAQTGNLEMVRLLLDRGADVNVTRRLPYSAARVSPLMIAALFGHLECVQLLLDRGADPHFRSDYGNALHFAGMTDRREIARLLLERGVDVNAQGRRITSFRNDTALTPLMYAATTERNDPALVEWLIERGADVNARASSGETALSLAQRRGETKVVAALRTAGARAEQPPSQIQPPSRLWNGSEINPSDSGVVRQAAETGLSVLLRSGSRLTEATGNRCVTCHQQSQPALAWGLARDRGLTYDRAIAADQLGATVRGAARMQEAVLEQPLPVPSISAWLLLGLHAAGHPPDGLTDSLAYALSRIQHPDGRWITRAARAPMDYSDVTSTALALRALTLYCPPTLKADFDHRVARAAAWLRTHPSAATEESALQILGLHWAGLTPPELAVFTEALVREQREDGGWAQLPTLPSDAYATGLALYSLHQSGGLTTAQSSYRRGIEFLVKTQIEDGSWLVPTRASPVQVAIDGVFPHGDHQWISSAATAWAALALMLGAEEERD